MYKHKDDYDIKLIKNFIFSYILGEIDKDTHQDIFYEFFDGETV